jgi:predicted permease
MAAILQGFATIALVIAAGGLLAHFRVLGDDARSVLTRVSFFVATPALMITVIGDADLAVFFSRSLIASAAGVSVTAVLYVLIAQLLWHKSAGETVLGTLASVFVNAGNLGLPIAAFVLGDVTLIAPMILLQSLVILPVALTVLDSMDATEKPSLWRAALRPLANPITLGCIAGIVLSIVDVDLPAALGQPLELIGGMAVPAMLLAYGIALRVGPHPQKDGPVAEVVLISILKLIFLPAIVWIFAVLLDLDPATVFAVTVIGALPTGHQVFVHASRYGLADVVVKYTIFATTILAVPVLLLVSSLLA